MNAAVAGWFLASLATAVRAPSIRVVAGLGIGLLATGSVAAHGPSGAPSASPDQLVVARGIVRDPATVHFLEHRFDVWVARSDTGEVTVALPPAALEQLRAAGLDLRLDPAHTASLRALGRRSKGQERGIPGFACYRTVEETYADMQALAQRRPDLVRVVDFGDSLLKAQGSGGYDLNAVVIENPAVPGPKAPFVLIGAIHAREYTTAELALRFAEALIDGYGVDPDVTWLVDTRSIHIAPHTNPDGRKRAEAGQTWRRNVRPNTCTSNPANSGVDLNRNSTFLWGLPGGSSTSGCSDTYRGAQAGSEPEVQAVEAYLAHVFPDQRGPALTDPAPSDATGVFISLHSYSRLVLFPWGAQNTAAPNREALQTLGRKFGYYNRYRVCQAPACLYAASGVTDDEAYGEYGVASYTFELGDSFFEPCSAFEGTILPQNLEALRYALKAARRPYLEPQGPEVVEASAVRLPDGRVQLRARADDTRFFSNGAGDEPTQTVAALRARVGSYPWLPGTDLVLAPEDGAYDQPIECGGGTYTLSLPPGPVTVYFVATDSGGRDGVPTAVHLPSAETPLFRNGFEVPAP